MFGSQAFVSEYAAKSETDANKGNLLAALGEAGFLLGLEKNRFFLTQLFLVFLRFGPPHNKSFFLHLLSLFFVCSDVVGMVSYAPLFVNTNDRRYVYLSHFSYIEWFSQKSSKTFCVAFIYLSGGCQML